MSIAARSGRGGARPGGGTPRAPPCAAERTGRAHATFDPLLQRICSQAQTHLAGIDESERAERGRGLAADAFGIAKLHYICDVLIFTFRQSLLLMPATIGSAKRS